jgi:anti-sigma factor RsiW
MHRLNQDHLEEDLSASHVADDTPLGAAKNGAVSRKSEIDAHLRECEECRHEVETMRRQSRMLRDLRAESDARPGFYARVMERIEAQRPLSIWNVFSDSPFGRRIAVASMALALLLGLWLVTSEQMTDRPIVVAGEDQPGLVLAPRGIPDRDSVLVNLVTYREQ